MRRASWSFGLVLLLAACGGRAATPPAEQAGTPRSPAAAAAADEARSDDPASPSSAFVAVRRPSDESLLEAPAHTLGGEGALEQIAAAYPLRVVRVRAQAGDLLAPGAPIVEVTSSLVLGAAASYRSASESLAVVEQRLAAVRTLREERIASTEQVFDLEGRAAELRGTQRAALATLRSASLGPSQAGGVLAHGVIVLTTERGGVVREMHAVPGEVHPDGQVFATLVTGPSRRVEARFPRVLEDGFRFEFEDLLGRHHPLGDHPSRTLDAGEEGGVLVWFDLPANADLPPEAAGHVHAIPTRASFVEVPVGALHPTDGGAEVLRRRGSDTARVPVTVIASSGSSAIVEGDLRVGDDVASDASGAIDAPAPGGD